MATPKLKLSQDEIERYKRDANGDNTLGFGTDVVDDLTHDLLLQTSAVERLEKRLSQAEDAMCYAMSPMSEKDIEQALFGPVAGFNQP